jgi:hypothetical protein
MRDPNLTTAIADMPAPTRIGSGDLLGRLMCPQCCGTLEYCPRPWDVGYGGKYAVLSCRICTNGRVDRETVSRYKREQKYLQERHAAKRSNDQALPR